MFGTIGPRKGIHCLAAAALIDGSELVLTLAGSIVPGYEDDVSTLAGLLRSHGVALDLRDHWHEEREAIELLGRARCVVLPYVEHYGMSRVLLEAAYAGTPVVVHNTGLLGHLVNTHKIGIAVDINSPAAFRRAIDALCHDDSLWESYHGATARFASRYSEGRFAATLTKALDAPRQIRP